FLMIAGAANEAGLWDEQDSYFYDVLHLVDGRDIQIKLKSFVGLVPVSAGLAYDDLNLDLLPDFVARANWFLSNHPEYLELFHMRDIGGVRHPLPVLGLT